MIIFEAKSFLNAIVTQNAKELKGFFKPDAIIKWEDSHEQLSVEGYIRANCEYPGSWQGKIKNIRHLKESDADMVVVSKINDDKGIAFHVVSFITLCENKKLITKLVEYYGDINEPPQWRKDMGVAIRYDDD
ncbi:MAG: nuclear transport factor 2 family protein [Defluviitaleaceae bacterium]|nr:nuclear transport factor 2 family protein [Defluviitaleaceae bacterium]